MRSLAPGLEGARYVFGVALLRKGQPEAALAEMQQESSEVWRMVGLPMAYYALGRKEESDAALAQLIAKYEDWSYTIAYVCAFRGDADHTFEWLDKAAQYGDTGLSDLAFENVFDNIKQDPRWLPFLRKIGKAPEQLAAIKFDVKVPQ